MTLSLLLLFLRDRGKHSRALRVSLFLSPEILRYCSAPLCLASHGEPVQECMSRLWCQVYGLCHKISLLQGQFKDSYLTMVYSKHEGSTIFLTRSTMSHDCLIYNRSMWLRKKQPSGCSGLGQTNSQILRICRQ